MNSDDGNMRMFTDIIDPYGSPSHDINIINIVFTMLICFLKP